MIGPRCLRPRLGHRWQSRIPAVTRRLRVLRTAGLPRQRFHDFAMRARRQCSPEARAPRRNGYTRSEPDQPDPQHVQPRRTLPSGARRRRRWTPCSGLGSLTPSRVDAAQGSEQGSTGATARHQTAISDHPTREGWSRHSDLNRGPAVYETAALPLSYVGAGQRIDHDPERSEVRRRCPDAMGGMSMDERTAVDLLDLAEDLGSRLTGPGADASLATLEARYAAIVAAIDWFVEADRADDALRLVHAMYRYWITQRRFDDCAAVFDRVLASGQGDPPSADGRCSTPASCRSGRAMMSALRPSSPTPWRSVAASRTLPDSQALGGLSRVALRTDVAAGRRLAHEALDVSAAADDEPGRSNALHLLGVGAQIAGDLPEARAWMTERLARCPPPGQRVPRRVRGRQPQHGRAPGRRPRSCRVPCREAPREPLPAHRDRFTPPFLFSGLAAIAVERGDLGRAARRSSVPPRRIWRPPTWPAAR